jgi:hypothetical protein
VTEQLAGENKFKMMMMMGGGADGDNNDNKNGEMRSNEKPRTPTARESCCNEATQSRSSTHSPTHQTHNTTKIQS